MFASSPAYRMVKIVQGVDREDLLDRIAASVPEPASLDEVAGPTLSDLSEPPDLAAPHTPLPRDLPRDLPEGIVIEVEAVAAAVMFSEFGHAAFSTVLSMIPVRSSQ